MTMAVKRKAEGIALLSVYAGSDDEDDAASESSEEESPRRTERDGGVKSAADVSGVPLFSVPGAGSMVSHGGVGIVDYAHDEAAASPEPAEVAEPASSFGRPLDIEILTENGNVQASPNGILVTAPSVKMPPEVDIQDAAQTGDKGGTQAEKSEESKEDEKQATVTTDFDILDDFLPPPPPLKYSEELQSKFAKYLALKKTGKSLNEQLRNTKGYRNPDFLQHAVKYHEIDQIGTCFRKEVFDPYGFDSADYYDALAQEQRREAERKEQERKQAQTQRIEFVRSGIQAAVGVVKPTVPVMQKVVAVTAAVETGKGSDGRANKKSKWDKFEPEGRSVQLIAVDAIAAANVHAALLSAGGDAGSGYASFAHHRRREAEDKLR